MPERKQRGRIWPWVVGVMGAAAAGVAILLWPDEAAADVIPDDDDEKKNGEEKKEEGKKEEGKKEEEAKPGPDLDGGRVPNVSGDPAGYNTSLYPSPSPVKLALRTVGYQVPWTFETRNISLNPELPGGEGLMPSPFWIAAQRDWNKVTRAIREGKIAQPKSNTGTAAYPFKGTLDTDGLGGPQSLNALEIMVHNQQKAGIHWQTLATRAKEALA